MPPTPERGGGPTTTGRPRRHAGPGRPSAPRPDRFAGAVPLIAACREAGCPVCRCVHAATLRELGALLAEHVTDPETRARVRESWGFCATHTALVREVPDAALGAGIVYEDLLGRVRRWLVAARGGEGRPPAPRGWRALLPRGRRARAGRLAADPRGPAAPCGACTNLAAAERRYLDALLGLTQDPALARAYTASAGLCFPHLALAVGEGGGGPGARALLDHAVGALDRLRADLRRFVDKHDHRVTAAFTAAEAASWEAALAYLAGRPELFGSHVERPARASGAR